MQNCETNLSQNCKIYPEMGQFLRYGMSAFGFLPAIIIFFVEDLHTKMERALSNEPKLYPILVAIGCISFLFFTYIVAKERRFNQWDYFKTSAVYGTITIAFFVKLLMEFI